MKKKIKNKDINDFRHELINRTYAKSYIFDVVSNDGKRNLMR